MMLVSLTSFCQYPTVKTIGKDTVVIMTLKQGEDINQRFIVLNDSIKTLNESISDKVVKINLSDLEKSKLDSLLVDKNKIILITEEELKKLRKIMEQRDKLHQQERTQWGLWMFFSFIITVLVGSSL